MLKTADERPTSMSAMSSTAWSALPAVSLKSLRKGDKNLKTANLPISTLQNRHQ